jgi:hypothetical protein
MGCAVDSIMRAGISSYISTYIHIPTATAGSYREWLLLRKGSFLRKPDGRREAVGSRQQVGDSRQEKGGNRQQTVDSRQGRAVEKPHSCHPERSEGSSNSRRIILSKILRGVHPECKDSSASPQNDCGKRRAQNDERSLFQQPHRILIPISNHGEHRDGESPGRIPHHPLFLFCGLCGCANVGSRDRCQETVGSRQ